MRIRQVVVEGLGHLSTLIVDDASGVAAVVDPRRDVDVYLDAAREADARITRVVETHLHNDYVSGGRELAALTGATHVIGAGAELAYEHRGVVHDEMFDVGYLRFQALHTPGHTPEHMSYAVTDASRAGEPLLLFTGGSLLVGAVGRTDLLGQANAVPWAHDQFRSLRDVLLPHQDFVAVHPTHGAGSLCSTGIASTPSSTIGFERRHNPMVRPIVEGRDVEAFVRTLLHRQPAVPRYFARMRPLNQAGPALLGGRPPAPRPMTADEAAAARTAGALIVDGRSAAAHAAAAPEGSISIPAGASFGTWLGWVVEPDQPVVLLLDDPADWDGLARQAMRIGYDAAFRGHIRGGFAAWTAAGYEQTTIGRLTVGDLAARLAAGGPDTPLVIDVRQPTEYAGGHVPGSVHLSGGELAERLDELPRDRPIATICASGYRSSIAASLLARAGFTDVTWVAEGLPAWKAAGLPTERGEGSGGLATDPSAASPEHDVAAVAGTGHAH